MSFAPAPASCIPTESRSVAEGLGRCAEIWQSSVSPLRPRLGARDGQNSPRSFALFRSSLSPSLRFLGWSDRRWPSLLCSLSTLVVLFSSLSMLPLSLLSLALALSAAASETVGTRLLRAEASDITNLFEGNQRFQDVLRPRARD